MPSCQLRLMHSLSPSASFPLPHFHYFVFFSLCFSLHAHLLSQLTHPPFLSISFLFCAFHISPTYPSLLFSLIFSSSSSFLFTTSFPLAVFIRACSSPHCFSFLCRKNRHLLKLYSYIFIYIHIPCFCISQSPPDTSVVSDNIYKTFQIV